MAEINVSDLTAGEGSPTGTGVFDELMKATEAHIESEYKKGRIKGTDYATVYLGGLQAVMDRSLQFLLQQQRTNLEAQLLEQQILNAEKEGKVLDGQKCKLDAEFDLIQEQILKTVAETALLNQKKVTEKAQTDGSGIGPDSVVGKQNALYDAQRDGYRRDAEQKAAKLLVDSWNVRKTMDDTTPVDDINKLGDTYIGASIQKLLDGINATV